MSVNSYLNERILGGESERDEREVDVSEAIEDVPQEESIVVWIVENERIRSVARHQIRIQDLKRRTDRTIHFSFRSQYSSQVNRNRDESIFRRFFVTFPMISRSHSVD